MTNPTLEKKPWRYVRLNDVEEGFVKLLESPSGRHYNLYEIEELPRVIAELQDVLKELGEHHGQS